MIVSDRYLTKINGLSQLPKPDRIDQILTFLKRPLDIALRNRFLYDAVKLLENDKGWDAKDIKTWPFTGLRELKPQFEQFREELGEELLHIFESKFSEVVKDTYVSFAEFENSRPILNTQDKFVDWFYQNMPYATLELNQEHYPNEQWDQEVDRRINWMLNQCPASEPLSAYAKDALFDYGKKFVFDWQIAEKSKL